MIPPGRFSRSNTPGQPSCARQVSAVCRVRAAAGPAAAPSGLPPVPPGSAALRGHQLTSPERHHRDGHSPGPAPPTEAPDGRYDLTAQQSRAPRKGPRCVTGLPLVQPAHSGRSGRCPERDGMTIALRKSA